MTALTDIQHQEDTCSGHENEIRIALFGVDDNTRKALTIVFGNYSETKCRIITTGKADMVFFDFDNCSEVLTWENFRSLNPNVPTIVFGSINPELEGVSFIAKPIGVSKIKKSLQQVILKRVVEGYPVIQESDEFKSLPTNVVPISPIHSKATSVALDASTSSDNIGSSNAVEKVQKQNSVNSATNFYDPKKYLQQVIHESYQATTNKAKAVILSFQTDGEMYMFTFLPNKKQVIVDTDEATLRRICTVPIACITHKMYIQNSGQTKLLESNEYDNDKCYSVENFLWSSAAWISHGRLPLGVDINALMRLRRWPNLTRLSTLDHAFSLSALFTEKPISISSIIRVLGVSKKEVLTFCSAASAINLLNKANQTTQKSGEYSEPKKSSKHSLFSNIISKLLNK